MENSSINSSYEHNIISSEITVDNEEVHSSRSELLEFMNNLVHISKEELTSGNYHYSLPQEFEQEYKEINEERSQDIINHMKWAWGNYREKCMGSDEIRPQTGSCHEFWGKMGMMVVESADTLWMMGLKKEYQEARDWIHSDLNFDMDHYTSVFETTIRVVGGLLSAYGLTGDDLYKEKAVDIADRLMKSRVNVLPTSNVHLATGRVRAEEINCFLSEFGTNVVEFDYLSRITGDSKYHDYAESLLNHLRGINKNSGLLPIFYHIDGKPIGVDYSIGNRADSYYEYLLKGYILREKKDEKLKRDFCEMLEGVEKKLIRKSANDHIVYIGELNTRMPPNIMHHLSCYFAGVLALAADLDVCGTAKKNMELAHQIAGTCFLMYNTTQSGLSSEMYRFEQDVWTKEREEMTTNEQLHGIHEKPLQADYLDMKTHTMEKYLLRPETIESLYILYSKTKNPIFREWGWKIWTSIKTFCKGEYAFADFHHVNSIQEGVDDRGETFFYSETLKYLYLLFSESGPQYLNDFVFNTEAHPIPIPK